MKKKIYILFSLTLFFLFFLYQDVEASTRCSYNWNGETIILEKKDNANFFDKIIANIDISIAEGEEIKAEQENSCPIVSFYHGSIVGNKIYSSFRECIGNVPRVGECSETEGTLLTEQLSSGNIIGMPQVVLVEHSDTSCTYEGIYNSDKITFKVKSEDGRTYRPAFLCISDSSKPLCKLSNSSGAHFYNGTATIKCPTYIYYQCTEFRGGRLECEILDSGGNIDNNYSGINGIEGDEPYTPLPPVEIETGPLDCNGIFQGPFGDFLKEIWKLIKFAVPILIIALSIVDFIKSISAHDESEIKKATNKLLKRLMIGVLVFVLPTIIEFLLHMAGIEFGTCNIK